MKIINEITSLREFLPWSGAVDTYNKIVDSDKEEEFINELEGIYSEGITEGQLNDLLWFEEEWCYELVGLNKWGVQPIDADTVLEGTSAIQDALDEAIDEFIENNKKDDDSDYLRSDFSALDGWDFESDLDDWLEDNQGEETDEDTLAEKWLEEVGYDIIHETVRNHVW